MKKKINAKNIPVKLKGDNLKNLLSKRLMLKIAASVLASVLMLTTVIPVAFAMSSSNSSSSITQGILLEKQSLDIEKVNFDNEEEVSQLANLAKSNIEKLLIKIKNDNVILEEKNLFTNKEDFNYSTKTNDNMAALLNKYDGYNALPKIIAAEAFAQDTNLEDNYNFEYLKNHLGTDGITFYRGLNAGHESAITVDEMVSEFKYGEFWNGYGATGNGTYFSPDVYIGGRYAFPKWCTEEEWQQGKIIQVKLAKDTKIITYNNLLKIAEKYKLQNVEIENKVLSGNYTVEDRIKILFDIGHLAEVLGYDAIAVEDGQNNIWEFVLLNRSKALVCEKDISYQDYLIR